MTSLHDDVFWRKMQMRVAPPSITLTREATIPDSRLPQVLDLLAEEHWTTVRDLRLDVDLACRAAALAGSHPPARGQHDLLDKYLSLLKGIGTTIESVRAIVADSFLPNEIETLTRKSASTEATIVDYRLVDSAFGSTISLLIFDDQLFLRQTYDQTTHASSWKLSGNLDEVSKALAAVNKITSDGAVRPRAILEPLLATADFISSFAETSCAGSYIDRGQCSWYHGSWQYLRLTDQVSTPTWHTAFFQDRLVQYIRLREPVNILISGAADYSMLAHVLAALRTSRGVRDSNDKVVIVDQCPTALFASKLYAEWIQLPWTVQIIQDEITHYSRMAPSTTPLGGKQPPRRFDIICTDAFLTRFDDDEVTDVLRAWRHLLSPQGLVLTTVRVHDEEPPSDEILHSQQQAFITTAYERSQTWAPFIRARPVDISRMAERYVTRMRSTSLGTLDVIRERFSREFQLVEVREVLLPGELAETPYLEMVCEHLGAHKNKKEPLLTKGTPYCSQSPPSWTRLRAEDVLSTVLDRMKSESAGNTPWGGNFASAVFACQVFARFGSTKPFDHVDIWIGDRFKFNDDGLVAIPDRSATIEGQDFDRIHEHIAIEDPARAATIDFDRFHRNWAVGLLLCHIASRQRRGQEPVKAYVSEFARRFFEREVTDDPRRQLVYPADVPWVTIRILTGLLDLIEANVTTPSLQKLTASVASALLRSIPPTGLLPSGTGEWNSPVSISATALSTLCRAVVLLPQLKDNEVSGRLNGMASRLDENRVAWDPLQSPVACAEVLVALRRYELIQRGASNGTTVGERPIFPLERYYLEEQQIMHWVLASETWQLARSSAEEQNDESSRVAYVASLLCELIALRDEYASGKDILPLWRLWDGSVPIASSVVDSVLESLKSAAESVSTDVADVVRGWIFTLKQGRSESDGAVESVERVEVFREAVSWIDSHLDAR